MLIISNIRQCAEVFTPSKKRRMSLKHSSFFCNFAFAVNNLTGNVSWGLPQLCKLPCINMQQNAGGQRDKINAKVKISIANTFLTHCFSWYARQPDKKQKQFENACLCQKLKRLQFCLTAKHAHDSVAFLRLTLAAKGFNKTCP